MVTHSTGTGRALHLVVVVRGLRGQGVAATTTSRDTTSVGISIAGRGGVAVVAGDAPGAVGGGPAVAAVDAANGTGDEGQRGL